MTVRVFARASSALAALGIFVLLAVDLRRAVNVPYWDEWEWADLVYAAHRHTLTFGQLWAPHNEHRILAANVLMLGLDALGGWNVVREQIVSLVIVALTQLTLWLLIAWTLPASRRNVCFVVASVVLLGLSQHENFEWGFQMSWFLCDLGLVVAVWQLMRPRHFRWSFGLAMVAATVASLSSSQGLVIWPAGLIAIAFVPRDRLRRAVLWLVVGAVVAAVVRLGSPGAGGAGHVGLGHVVLLTQYALAYLGAPLGLSGGTGPSLAAGVALVLWLAAIGPFAVRASLRTRIRVAPWLAVAAYPVLCALVTASARAGFGVEQAVASRYTSIGALGWIAALAATFVLVPRGRRVAIPVALAGLVAVFSLQQSVAGNHDWHVHAVQLRDARAALVAGDPRGLSLIYPRTDRVESLLQEMAEVHDGVFSAP